MLTDIYTMILIGLFSYCLTIVSVPCLFYLSHLIHPVGYAGKRWSDVQCDVVAKDLSSSGTTYWFESVWEDKRTGATNDAGNIVLSFDISGYGKGTVWPFPDWDDYNYICGSGNITTFSYGTTAGQK